MTYETRITNLQHGDELHQKAKLQIDEKTGAATFTIKKGAIQQLLRRENTRIQHKITATTNIEADYPTIKIDETTFEIQNRRKFQAIVDLATQPQRSERRATERLIREAEEATRNLLKKRGDTLKILQNFKKNPRKTLRYADWEVIDSPDPVVEYQRQVSEDTTQAYTEAASKIESLSGHLTEEKVQRIYAAIYGVERAQDAAFSEDEELFRKASTLIERATSQKMKTEQLWRLPIPAFTEEMIEDLNAMTRSFIEQTCYKRI